MSLTPQLQKDPEKGRRPKNEFLDALEEDVQLVGDEKQKAAEDDLRWKQMSCSEG